jgi:hypothetical protein
MNLAFLHDKWGMEMNATRKRARVFMMLTFCALLIACTQPGGDIGSLQDEFDEFEVAIGFPRDKAAVGRSTINDDAYVEKVYVKVYNSSNEHLPAVDNTGSEISGATKLTKSGSTWSATVKLVSPVSGTITFELWAVTSWGMTLYAGETSHTVGSNGNSITIPTQAASAIRSAGPAGGYIFYDKGSYSDGWRFMEAAPYGWYDGAGDSRGSYTGDEDPFFQWGANYYGVGPSAAATAVGTGETNTANIVSYHNSLGTLYPEKGDYYTYPGNYFSSNDGTVAAKVCADYSLVHGGVTYSDWFLPSKDELNLMWNNLKNQSPSLGGFHNDYYWSSSENGYSWVWSQVFWDGDGDGFQCHDNRRPGDFSVRPVRSF